MAGGAEDPCISNGNGIDGLYHFLKKRFKNVNMKKFQQMRHEIQNESCKDELLLSIESYLNSWKRYYCYQFSFFLAAHQLFLN